MSKEGHFSHSASFLLKKATPSQKKSPEKCWVSVSAPLLMKECFATLTSPKRTLTPHLWTGTVICRKGLILGCKKSRRQYDANAVCLDGSMATAVCPTAIRRRHYDALPRYIIMNLPALHSYQNTN